MFVLLVVKCCSRGDASWFEPLLESTCVKLPYFKLATLPLCFGGKDATLPYETPINLVVLRLP